MKELENIPFKLGMHYEHWEFELDSKEDLNELERYKYIGDGFKFLFGLEIAEIYLYFSLDILQEIEIFFCSSYPMNITLNLLLELKNITLAKDVILRYKKDRFCILVQ